MTESAGLLRWPTGGKQLVLRSFHRFFSGLRTFFAGHEVPYKPGLFTTITWIVIRHLVADTKHFCDYLCIFSSLQRQITEAHLNPQTFVSKIWLSSFAEAGWAPWAFGAGKWPCGYSEECGGGETDSLNTSTVFFLWIWSYLVRVGHCGIPARSLAIWADFQKHILSFLNSLFLPHLTPNILGCHWLFARFPTTV